MLSGCYSIYKFFSFIFTTKRIERGICMTDDDYLQFLLPTCFLKICLYLDDEEEGEIKWPLIFIPKIHCQWLQLFIRMSANNIKSIVEYLHLLLNQEREYIVFYSPMILLISYHHGNKLTPNKILQMLWFISEMFVNIINYLAITYFL